MSTWIDDARGRERVARDLLLNGDYKEAATVLATIPSKRPYRFALEAARASMSEALTTDGYPLSDHMRHMVGWASHWLYHHAPKAALATLRRYHLLAQKHGHHAHDDEAFALELEARSILARQEGP